MSGAPRKRAEGERLRRGKLRGHGRARRLPPLTCCRRGGAGGRAAHGGWGRPGSFTSAPGNGHRLPRLLPVRCMLGARGNGGAEGIGGAHARRRRVKRGGGAVGGWGKWAEQAAHAQLRAVKLRRPEHGGGAGGGGGGLMAGRNGGAPSCRPDPEPWTPPGGVRSRCTVSSFPW